MESITFRCGSCNQQYTVGADKAGKKTKCVKCGTFLKVPAGTPQKPLVESRNLLEQETLTKNPEVEVVEAGIEIVEDPPQAAIPTTKSKPQRQVRIEEEAEAETKTYTKKPVSRKQGSAKDDADATPLKARIHRRTEPEQDDTAVAEIDEKPIRRKKPLKRASDWKKVRLGLLVHLIVLVVTVGTIILSFAAAPFILPNLLRDVQKGFDSISSFIRVVQIGYFCLTLLWFAGCCLFLFAPWENNSKSFAIALLVVGSSSLLITTFFNPLGLKGTAYDIDNVQEELKSGNFKKLEDLKEFKKDMIKAQLFGLFTFLLAAAKQLLVPVFLWSLAQCLKARGLDDNCLTLSKYTIGFVIIGFISQAMSIFPFLAILSWCMFPLGILAFICTIGQLIWTFLILINTRRVIEDKYC